MSDTPVDLKPGSTIRAVASGVAFCAALFAVEALFSSMVAGGLSDWAHHYLIFFIILLSGIALTLVIVYKNRYDAAREKLVRSENRFRTAFHTSPDSININRLSDGLYLDVNEGFCQLTGFSREEVVGKTSVEISIWADLEDRKRLVEGLRSKGVVTNLEANFRRKDGTVLPCLMSARVIMLDGEPHILSVTRVIAELRAAQEAKLKSQEKYARIFESVQDMYYEATVRGVLLDITPSVKNVLGYEPEEVIGNPIVNFYADPGRRTDFVRELTTTGEVNDYLVELTNKRGGTTHVSVNAKLVPDPHGGETRYCGTIRDVDLQCRAQEALARSESKYRALVEHANSIILRLDSAGKILFLNEFALDFLGYGIGELLGRSASQVLFPPMDREGGDAKPFPTPGEESEGTVVAEILKKDGRRAWVNWSVRIDRDDAGGVAAYLCVGNDVTAEVEAERKVQLMEAHLAQAQKFEALGTLASGIAHDFNNVLSAVVGYAELSLISLPEGSPAIEHQNAILAAGSRAAQLVRQILTFARRTEDKRTVTVLLAPLTREVLKFLRASLPANVAIEQRIAADMVVEADPTRLHQILMNLCTNAVKAMPDGGTLTVSLSRRIVPPEAQGAEAALKPGEYCLLTVEDTGVGMTPEVLARSFDPFFTTRGGDGGTGMGLAVVRGIVADMKGDILVESEPGKGSAFKVYLPVASPESIAAETREHEVPRGTERILLVEDELPIADATAKNLESLGYRVTVATEAPTAILTFENAPSAFDLIIADMTMPGMTGDLLVARFRTVRPDVPVILCSGFSERMDEDKAAGLSLSAYLIKPLTRGDLARAARKALDEAKAPQ